MYKLYIIKTADDKYGTVRANHKPVGYVTDKFEGQETTDITLLDIIDDLDPITNEVIGKKAVFNQSKLDAKLSAEQTKKDAYELVKYKDQRRAEYPAIGDQLDALYKKLHLGDSTDYDTIAEQITAIKLKYPKP